MTRLSMSANHVYWLRGSDGKKHRIPSVSKLKKSLYRFENDAFTVRKATEAVTGDWDTLAGLPGPQRQEAAFATAWTATRSAMMHGTAIHSCVEQLWTGEPVDVPADYAGHVQAVADHVNQTGLQFLAAEQMAYSDTGLTGECAYAGTIDLVVKQPGRGVGIVDLKTWMPGSSGDPRDSEWLFQLAAYHQLQYWSRPDDDTRAPDYQWVGIWHVGPDGLREYIATPNQLQQAINQVDAARYLLALPKPKMQEKP